MTNLSIPTGLDPTVVNLARAIRKQESGGNYNAIGDTGTSSGAYQWSNYGADGKRAPVSKGTVPSLFKEQASKYGLDPNDFSPKNQDMVAYNNFKALKDQGKNVIQIAAIHNGGDENRYDPNYVTPSGLPSKKVDASGKVIYDVPGYAKAVNDEYQKLKAASSNQTNQTNQTIDQAPPAPLPEDSLGTKVYKGVAGFLTDPAMTLYGGARNLVTGEDNPTVTNPLTGNTTQALGYDEQGNPLSGMQTAVQGVGAAAQYIPQTKLLGMLGKGAQIAKLGVNPVTESLVKGALESGKIGAVLSGAEGMRNIGANETGTESALNIAGDTALGGVGGVAFGMAGAGAGKIINKLTGKESIQSILNRVQELDRAGKTAEADAIRNSPEIAAELHMAGINPKDIASGKQLTKDVAGIDNAITDGISRSTESAALKRTLLSEKFGNAEKETLASMARPPSNTDESIWAPTISHINNTITDLYDSGATPLLEKARKTGIQLGENINPDNIVNLVDKELKGMGGLASTRESLVENFRNIIKQEVQAAQEEGRVFDIGDLFRLKTAANEAFEKISPKGELGRATGNVLRNILDKQANTVTNPEARAIITHLRQIDKSVSHLYKTKQLAEFMSKLPSQRTSVWLNRMAGFAAMGGGGGPLAYPVAAMSSDSLQKAMMASRTKSILGGIGGKFKATTPDTLIGKSQNIMDKLDNLVKERDTNRNMAKTLAKISKSYTKAQADEAQRLTDRFKGNPVPIDNKYTPESKLPVIQTGETPVSKYNQPSNLPVAEGTPNVHGELAPDSYRQEPYITDNKLPVINMRGMGTPETLAALGGTGALGLEAYNKMQADSKYTADQTTPEEPFMKPVVNEHILSPKEEKASKLVPASMINTVKQAMEHTGMTLDKVINHMKAENGGKWDPNLVGHADPTDRGVTQLNPLAIGILEGTTGPKVDFFQQNFGHKFDINNVTDQILGYATYMNWLKQYALPEQGIKNPTDNDAMLAYNLGAKGLSEIKNKTADATTTARYARYYTLLKQNGALD